MVILLAVVITLVAQTILGRFGETPIPDRRPPYMPYNRCVFFRTVYTLIGSAVQIGRTKAAKRSGRSDVIENNAQRLRANTSGIFPDGTLNPSICFLISLAKAAAPAPFTTR